MPKITRTAPQLLDAISNSPMGRGRANFRSYDKKGEREREHEEWLRQGSVRENNEFPF